MRKNAAYETMAAAAADPGAYIATWRERHPGQKVAAVLPMNFPAELLAAAGVLPVIVQESRGDDSEGRSLLAEFYCGYTRDLAQLWEVMVAITMTRPTLSTPVTRSS
jgi:hypothetical protein